MKKETVLNDGSYGLRDMGYERLSYLSSLSKKVNLLKVIFLLCCIGLVISGIIYGIGFERELLLYSVIGCSGITICLFGIVFLEDDLTSTKQQQMSERKISILDALIVLIGFIITFIPIILSLIGISIRLF